MNLLTRKTRIHFMNNTLIRRKLKGKTILITGGTGSFGNSVISHLLKMDTKKIIIFSRDEKKQFDMRNKYNNQTLSFVIGDVRDKEEVKHVVKGVDFVFHAAALKQVPTCEFFPLEAVKTNILGASNVISASLEQKVKQVVILSTDKAVYPINAMGMTKALMEKMMIAYSKDNNTRSNKGETVLCGVRYGNVLFSRGSVIPYFINLMRQNKVIPVTSYQMSRFLLPLPQAVDLVLYALTNGENGCMYVRKAPACILQTLAEALCQIFDYKKGYKEVGIRAGEKIHETLVSEEEYVRAAENKDYFKIPPESQGLDYNKYLFQGSKPSNKKIGMSYTSDNTEKLNVAQTKKLLLSLEEVKSELASFGKGKSPLKSVYTVID